ncbi:terminus macrodomain insulation protein YfbV [Shewanella avicenniae]|uniref:terminus macrodomain insulation protein YfbV n=1 Tax=Shewanella avicenniae TaxID=2814294 RepID=UPI001E63050F|nr:terminus macrodomain insulation protein YfbV [Shewanella avicenniae]
MSPDIFITLRDGQRYMRTWPLVPQLGYFFPEYRVIKATQLAKSLLPLLALVAGGGQLLFLGWTFLPQALATTLFFISLPLQGVLWLGWRSRHPLPVSLLGWGNELNAKLAGLGISARPLGGNACYMDIAVLLKLAFERLDKKFWDEL